MKTTLITLLTLTTVAFGNPEIANIVAQEYGAATSDGILLLQSAPSAAEPVQWTVYAQDPFRQGDLVRAELSQQGRGWVAKPTGAGDDLLRAKPPAVVNFSRVKFRSSSVREIAARAAVEAKTTFSTIEYQLAVNSPTGSPDWGLALLDKAGNEVGFLLISAETGVVSLQQWANSPSTATSGFFGSRSGEKGEKGERAAQQVKEGARRAWDWTDGARKETKSFFKELFSR